MLLPEQPPRTAPERQVAWAWGEVALAQGDPGRALAGAEQLLATIPGEAQAQPIPHLLRQKGEALAALGRLGAAAAALEEAQRGAELRGDPSVRWRVHRALAQVYRRQRRAEEAQRELDAAHENIAKLAGALDDPALRELFQRAALASLPGSGRGGAQSPVRTRAGGLSSWEAEVAALVARGCTNREIAATLVVSERTAEAHVSNILAKLALTTRAQIAAWAVEHGLTGS